MKRVLHSVDKFSEWCGTIIAPLALAYMAILMIEIIARYLFNSPTKWAHEISTFIFGAQFMLAGAYCFWRGSMVNVEIIYNRFPIRVRAIIDLFTFLLPLFMCVTMIWMGWAFFWDSFLGREVSQTVFGPPLYPMRAVIPISAFLLLVQVAAKFIRDISLAVTGKELE